MTADWQNALERARNNAPFLANALNRMPEVAALLADGDGEAAIARARAFSRSDADIGVRLRRERLGLALALAIGDLAGAFPLERVMRELSDFADRALDAAIRDAIVRRTDRESTSGFIALALGKHGAGELNYSSDIDPILIYDPESLPRRDRDEPGEAAQRYARHIVRLLSDNTAEGYVFRVDLRLRPASEVSPLAISRNAALSHYESSALAWERAAFIRARACAGDLEAGEDFLAAIRPFVWRRSLDFGAIDEISRLTARIREAHTGPVEPQPGYNVKQGRGGIREVEFYAQTYQLIHGGRDRSLRVRGTRAALDALAAGGHIPAGDAAVLGAAYDRLRTVEHRLQMVEDHQTHALPADEALNGVARLDGLADAHALLDDLQAVTARVAECFGALIDEDDENSASPRSGPGLVDRLETLGYSDPSSMATRIESWSDGRFKSLRSASAREAFDRLLPDLLETFAGLPEPDRALIRWEALLEKTPSALNLFRLLDARPALVDQLAHVITLAPPLGEELGRRPDLLDTLIDKSALDLPDDVAQLRRAMERTDGQGDYERQLDRIRIVTGEARFTLGVQLIEAVHDPIAIGRGLSRCAEAALQVARDSAARDFAQDHGLIDGGELVVLGLGRLGGGILTHASDLDIVYLFTGSHSAESDGRRPLGATMYFNRLAQRVSAALSVPTAQGALYEVDTRLRPQGNQGPLAVSLESFARYQREDAWTWEHMALTRARVMAGSDEARGAVEQEIDSILRRARDPAELRHDVLKMRAEMARAKAAKGPLDAKLLRGGLVDLEFLVHFLQLRERIGFDADLAKAIAALADAGLLDRGLGEAHDLMTRMLIGTRLLAPDLDIPSDAAGRVLAKACGMENPDALLHAFDSARQQIADAWRRHFETELETDDE